MEENKKVQLEAWKKTLIVEDFPNIKVPEDLKDIRGYITARNNFLMDLMEYDPSINLQEMADVFGVSRELIRITLKKQGFTKTKHNEKVKNKYRKIVSDEDLIEYANNHINHSWKEIADHFKVSEEYVKSFYLENKGVVKKRKGPSLETRIKYKEIVDYIKDNEDLTYREIAKDLGIAVGTLQKATSYYGYRQRLDKTEYEEWQEDLSMLVMSTSSGNHAEVGKVTGLTPFIVSKLKTDNYPPEATTHEVASGPAARRLIRDMSKYYKDNDLHDNGNFSLFERCLDKVKEDKGENPYLNLTNRFIKTIHDNNLEVPKVVLDSEEVTLDVFNKYYYDQPDDKTLCKRFFKDTEVDKELRDFVIWLFKKINEVYVDEIILDQKLIRIKDVDLVLF